MPELSVVIPIFNRQAAALRAVASVLAQDVGDLEVLLVDDGSEPRFELPDELARDCRLQLIRHDSNRGAAGARNTGMRAARGTWVAFLDSDDRWLNGTLAPRLAEARARAAADSNPLQVHVAGFAYAGAARGLVRIPISASDPLDFASGCWFSPGSTALFRRELVMARIGGQDENLRRFEDVDWFLRIALAGGGIVASRIVAAEIEPGPRPLPAAVEREGRRIVRKFAAMADLPKGAEIVRRLRAWLAFELASANWHARDYGRTAGELLRSWYLAPRAGLYMRRFWSEERAREDYPGTR